MKRWILSIVFGLVAAPVILLVLGFAVPRRFSVQAAVCDASNPGDWRLPAPMFTPASRITQYVESSITIQVCGLDPAKQYALLVGGYASPTQSPTGGCATYTYTDRGLLDTAGKYRLVLHEGASSSFVWCEYGQQLEVVAAPPSCNMQIDINPSYTPSCVDTGSSLLVSATEVKKSGSLFTGPVTININRAGVAADIVAGSTTITNGVMPALSIGLSSLATGHSFKISLDADTGLLSDFICTKQESWMQIVPSCATRPTGGGGAPIEPYDPECDGGAGIKSALGCIPVSAQAFTDVIMPWAIGLGSGIAFLLGIYGAFLIATASGDPEKVQAGKELITSAVAGILLVIFTVILLTVIGVDILGLFSF